MIVAADSTYCAVCTVLRIRMRQSKNGFRRPPGTGNIIFSHSLYTAKFNYVKLIEVKNKNKYNKIMFCNSSPNVRLWSYKSYEISRMGGADDDNVGGDRC